MKVKELIAILSQFDENDTVCVDGGMIDCREVGRLWVIDNDEYIKIMEEYDVIMI